jgi:hypothetical protein
VKQWVGVKVADRWPAKACTVLQVVPQDMILDENLKPGL